MRDSLFLPFKAADGQRRYVALNDIPGLFSEGLEEPEPEVQKTWQSAWQKLGESVSRRLESLRFATLRGRFQFHLDHGATPSAYLLRSHSSLRLRDQKLIG